MIRRFLSTTKNFPVNVTDQAWNKMGNIIKNKNAFCFSLDAKSGGCNGFSYDMKLLDFIEYTEAIELYKFHTLMENGESRLFIEPSTEMILMGTTIDYIKEDYDNGIFESKFTFTPDREKATSCGCGVSFNPIN